MASYGPGTARSSIPWAAYCLLSAQIPSLGGAPCELGFCARQRQNKNIENNPMQSDRQARFAAPLLALAGEEEGPSLISSIVRGGTRQFARFETISI
jgi:hypothetical protein